MRGATSKLLHRLAVDGLASIDKGHLPERAWKIRKFKTNAGHERYQLLISPECVRFRYKDLKRWVKGLRKRQYVKPVKNVGFGSRRKARNQQIRASIPKFTKQGELIHNV